MSFYVDEPDYNQWTNEGSEFWSGTIPATLMIKENRSKFFEIAFDLPGLEKEVKLVE
ncbi:MAG: hypothetical protein ACI9K1_000182 [Arcticibacterium sp.]|jgi:hypothetical protein